MNPGFKLRYDQMRQGSPTSPDSNTNTNASDHYSSLCNTRNVCFNWPDGRQMFFNYAYLIACEFKPEADKNIIQLVFSSHLITLKGYSLEPLFVQLLDHLPRIIAAIHERYAPNSEQDVIVTDIVVNGNNG